MDEFAKQNKVQYCPKFHTVNTAVTWEEGYSPYPGRSTRVPDKREGISHRNKLVSDAGMNCKKSAEAIVKPKEKG